jgi:hypothetical protein
VVIKFPELPDQTVRDQLTEYYHLVLVIQVNGVHMHGSNGFDQLVAALA